MRALSGCLAVVVLTSGGCAQITTTHRVEIVPKRGAEPRVLGSPHGQVTHRGVEASWTQAADELTLSLLETRDCAVVRHEPVVRVDHVERKTGGALYWEYGLAGATLALGLTGLIRPQLFSQSVVNADGDQVQDLRAGYRIGGIFTAIGAAFLTAGIYDTVRGRDETRYADAYRVHRGETVQCAQPQVAMAGQDIELIVGAWQTDDVTDEDGKVTFALPGLDELGVSLPEPPPPQPPPEPQPQPAAEPEPEPEPPPPPPPPRVTIKGVVKIDKDRALAVELVVPYDHPDAQSRGDSVTIAPIRVDAIK